MYKGIRLKMSHNIPGKTCKDASIIWCKKPCRYFYNFSDFPVVLNILKIESESEKESTQASLRGR